MLFLSIGADPEMFVSNNGRPGSAIGRLGGSKYAPRMINGYGIQEDNMLAEFSMPPVISNGYYMAPRFSKSIQEGIHNVERELKSKGMYVLKGTSHSYSPRTLNKYGKAALEFGCDPDFNAYTGEINPAPDNKSTLRTAGGHVHVGFDRVSPSTQRMVVKAMDLFLGVPSVLLDPDNRRRDMYGKAGAYRPKDYGLEYRTLSNFWIHDDYLRRWVCDRTAQAVNNADSINLIIAYFGEDYIQDCINTGNVEMANGIIKALGIALPAGENEEGDLYAHAA